MMKLFKRISAMFMAIIMTVAVFGTTTAFAAEDTSLHKEDIIEITSVESGLPQPVNDVNVVLSNAQPSAAGNPFVAEQPKLWFGVEFYPTNGSVVVAVRLHDKTTNQVVQEWQSSNGSINKVISLTQGHTYIFEYLRAYGTQNVSLHNYGFGVTG